MEKICDTKEEGENVRDTSEIKALGGKLKGTEKIREKGPEERTE